MSLSVTIYDLYTAKDKLAFVDPMRSGRSEYTNEETASNVSKLIHWLVPDADEETLGEIRRIVKVNYDMERTMGALFEELERNVSYNVADVAVKAKGRWEQFLNIGL